MCSVVNIILRIEHAGEQPHPSMESVGDPRDGIWVKDNDVFPDEQHMVFPWLKEAIALAAEIKGHEKYLYLCFGGGRGTFRLEPALLKEMAEAGCILEIDAGYE